MAVPSAKIEPRRVWIHPVPARRRKRFRRLRRLLKVALGLIILGVIGIVYVLQVYAPGLRVEASTIPQRVKLALQSSGAKYVPGIAISMKHAIVAIEDRRFYSHPGVDPIGLTRALWVNLTQQHVDQGGSTLEEQLAKRMIVHDDQSLHAKLRTMALGWAIDQDFSKAHILELYLNAAYFGRGAYGIGQAAQTYFGTDAAHLSLPEAAFLAALPQAPSVYGDHPTGTAVTSRWHTVLQDMVASGYISAAQEQTALGGRLAFALPNP